MQHHGAARRLMCASGVGQQRHAPHNDTYLSHMWCLLRRAERSLHVLLLLQAGCSAHPGCCKATRGCSRLSSSPLTPLPTAISCSCSLAQLAPAAAPSRVGPPWGAPASSKPPPAGQAGKAPSPSHALCLSVLPVSQPALPSCGSHGAANGPSHKGAG